MNFEFRSQYLSFIFCENAPSPILGTHGNTIYIVFIQERNISENLSSK